MQESINNQSMLKVGTILHGTYRIDSYLSSGGFGNTYVATNVEFEERVAIKEFFMKGVTQRDDNQTTVSVSNSENNDSFLGQKEKFKKEARRIRQLKNEHIIAVHDLFEENGTAYYVMDFVDGENLSERLKHTGEPMSENEVRDILPQILDALKSVHDAGIWHLDLKPANIMLTKEGKVKLIDFGASKQLDAQKGGATTSTAISYTNGYAPREQMEQNYDKFGPWTDIYALGATLYNLLTNKRPPLPTDIDDDISEDKHNALPFPENVGGMKYLVLQMMKTNRLQRPQSIDAIISAEKARKEEPKQAPKQQPTSQKATVYDDEATIIAEPKYKKEEKIVESKVKTQPSTQSLNNNSRTIEDNKGFRNWSTFGVIVVCIVAGVLWPNFGHDNKSTDTSDTEVIAIETEKNAKEKDVMFDQSQIETSILMHLDTLAAELGKMPFFLSNVHKNTDISVYDISVENENNDMYILRLIGAIDVNKKVAKMIGVSTSVFNNKLATLINDLNYTPLKDYYQRGMISDLSYSLYTKMKADGKINYYWQIAAATIVEKLYLVSQNPRIISKNMNDWDVANLTFCLVLVLDAIDRLSLYDSELEIIAQAITPLDILNATSQSELITQISQAKEYIISARNIILGK